MRCILDTSAVIGLVERRDPDAVDAIAQASTLWVSRLTIAELWHGHATSPDESTAEQRAATLEDIAFIPIAEDDDLWPAGQRVERRYGRVSAISGRRLSQADRWIVAIAAEFGLVLLTEDSRQATIALHIGVECKLLAQDTDA